ncbi:acyl-CoA dehydrogenase family protein [Mycobacterium sp. 1274761.0]|uniref:acyl-CoA dehydrogenase family protein n=1 Tax=Mycobacterium sp. 1274761.0 TaxID=1834077 RepID=UPI001E3F6057|nr:acyl-CoA dehydrogenase family protein [Mycobacterium sp. 1274761.0]
MVAKSLDRSTLYRSAGGNELTALVDDVGRRSFDARLGHRSLPEEFDGALWHTLEATGLSRLTSGQDAAPAEAAIMLAGLARHACAVPIAETDLLAAWLAGRAGVSVPGSGPLTVAIADAEIVEGLLRGTAEGVPWPHSATALLAARTADALHVGVIDDASITVGHNLAGEPRGAFSFELPVERFTSITADTGDELDRRGAWARCVQIVGALDAAARLTVAHTRDRQQFGRPLSAFQAVQHSLAAMAGEIERARAATDLAVAAATDYGFDSDRTDYAVTVAKVAVGRAVAAVTTIAHQLHGAIGVTREHQLWLATMRARSWADEFGSTAFYARRLGRLALTAHARSEKGTAPDPWDVVVSGPTPR